MNDEKMSARTPARTPRKRRAKRRELIVSKEDLKREKDRARQAKRRHKINLQNEHVENKLTVQQNKIRRLEKEKKKLEDEVASLSEALENARSHDGLASSVDISDAPDKPTSRADAQSALDKIVINDDDADYESPKKKKKD